MKRSIVLVVVAILLTALLAGCAGNTLSLPEKNQGVEFMPPTISVNGTGKVSVVPDIATINIGVESQSENVSEALAANNEKAKAISAKLQELGVEVKDIQTSNFNIYPIHNYNPEGQPTDTRYNVNNTVVVTVRDLSSLGKLLDEVVQSGANSINGISFNVQDRSKAVSEARRLAVEDARAQADEVAAAAGVSITRVYNISVYIDDGAQPMYDMKVSAESSEVPVSAGQLSITVQVSATYEIAQ